MSYYENSKTYTLRMIFTYYAMYVMIVDYAVTAKFYTILVCLFFVSFPLCWCMCRLCL